MRRNRALWACAIVVTLASAVYQRVTGPSYPLRGHVVIGGDDVRYRLARGHDTSADQVVHLEVPDSAVTGELHWRRVPSPDPVRVEPLVRRGSSLEGTLPRQPAGGKLQYQMRLIREPELVLVPATPTVTRFKDPVSPFILGPHILAMFLGMLWSTRAGIAALAGDDTRALAWTTLGLLVIGGFIFGPLTQHEAFGPYWTGIPYGYDLTDNKTLLAVVIWAIAVWRVRVAAPARATVALAAMLTIVVFAIPHSVWGTEIDWHAARAAQP